MKGLARLVTGLATVVATVGAGQALAESDYRIGPRDLLTIQVAQIAELNVERRVSDQGEIDLPLLGKVQVSELTEAEVGARIKSVLESRYLQREAATVSVSVKEFRSRPISVIGAVQKPGPLNYPGRWTLIEALTAAGGLVADHGSTIYILRRAGNGLSDQLAVDADALLLRGDPRANVPIFANDLINVPAAVSVTIFLVGEIKTPGAVTFKSNERITFLTALARGGGLTDRASRTVVIRRRLESGVEREIEIDARRILAGKDADPELKQGDVIVVKESFF